MYEQDGALQWGDPRCKQMTAAIYCRKSTATEGRSKSREEQLERSQQDATAYGFGHVEIYMEAEGQKGDWWWKDGQGRNPGPHRPELTRLVERVESGRIQAVIVYKQDRLVRDAGVGDALAKLFRKHSVRYICQGRDTEINTARGMYQIALDSAAARQWRDQISEDIRRDQHYKARLGMFTRNPACLGFRSKGKGSQAVEPIWSELELVRRIFRMFVAGEDHTGPLGVTAIARTLMDEGTSLSVGARGHTSRNPRKVFTSQITTILRNPMYVGKWRHNGELYKCDRLLVPNPATGEAETAVPTSLFDAAQAKLNAQPRTGKKAATSKHLLAGLVVCGCCGRPLHVHTKRRADGSKQLAYLCSRKRDSIPCDRAGMANVLVDQLDSWVIDHLAPWIAEEYQRVLAERHASPEEGQLRGVEAELAGARLKETEGLAEAIGVLDKDQLERLALVFRNRREALERRIEQLRALAARRDAKLPALEDVDCRSLSRTHLKTLLRSAIQWIAVTAKGVIALTTWGAWVAGEFAARKPKAWNLAGESRRCLQAPSPAACVKAPLWLAKPDLFIAGRRQYLGARAEFMADEVILPLACENQELDQTA